MKRWQMKMLMKNQLMNYKKVQLQRYSIQIYFCWKFNDFYNIWLKII